MLKIALLVFATAFFFVFFITSIIEGKVYAELWLERKIHANIDNEAYFKGYLKNIVGAMLTLAFSISTSLLLIRELIK